MTSITFTSEPSGAEVELDGEYVGTTPCDVTIGNDMEIGEDVNIDMVVFVSPQYKNDTAIINSINAYSAAVKEDIGWNVVTMPINDVDNQYTTIAGMISDVCSKNDLKACLMVGEDMAQNNNVFHTSIYKKCQQAIVFWQSYGGNITTSCANKVIVATNTVRVPTSLMYPNSNDPYSVKSSNIIAAFNKFSTDRRKTHINKVISFYDTYFDFRDILTTETSKVGDAEVIGCPSQAVVDSMLTGEFKLVVAAGHGSPGTVAVTPSVTRFRASTHGKTTKTPMLIVYGCSTAGWYTNIENDCLYQPPSNRAAWHGHCIFDNPSIRVVIGGFPIGRDGNEFIAAACLSKMATGKTVAEAMRGISVYGSNTTLHGDPTFHY